MKLDFKNRSSQNGFSLIEALVAIAIISVSILATTLLFISISVLSRESRDKLTASKAGQSKIDSLRNSDFSNLRTEAEAQLSSDPTPETVTSLHNGLITTYIMPIDTNGGGIAEDDEDSDGIVVDADESEDEDESIFQIKIEVTWINMRGDNKTESLITTVSNNGL